MNLYEKCLFPRCSVHTLQLAVKDGLKSNHAKDFVAKLRAAAVELRTPHVDETLRRVSKNKKGAIFDQATRWIEHVNTTIQDIDLLAY